MVLSFFILYRCVLIYGSNLTAKSFFDAVTLGLRFDSRWAGILSIPLLFFYLLQLLTSQSKSNNPARWYARILLPLLLLLFVFDYYYYQYTGTRLSPVILELISPLSVAAKMVWQSYPVLILFLILVITVYLLDIFLLKKIFYNFSEIQSPKENKLLLFLLLIIAFANIWGSFKKYPLTWSDAFKDPSTGVMVLNPAESFFYGLFYEEDLPPSASNLEKQLLRASVFYNSTRAKEMDSIKRMFSTNGKPLNVVIILAESLATHKTSFARNQPFQTTPFLKKISDSSFFFTNCYTPHYGTARTVWNLFTGFPDVNWKKLATHQLQLPNLPVLLNQMSFTEKYYLLGGNGTWADIKGFLKSNVKDMAVLDAEQMKSKPSSVWGVDDFDLLNQANELFSNSRAPFFAVIQTASNHQPYTIPASAKMRGFVSINQKQQELNKFGFAHAKDYNSLRYMDFCLQSFFKQASSSSYFQNTLFIIVGDHGTSGKALNSMSADWDTYKLKLLHVPLLFYKPGVNLFKQDSSLCSIQDILPTVYGLQQQTNISGIGGIDLFSGYYKTGQFFMLHDLHQLGWIAPKTRYIASFVKGRLEHILTNETSLSDSIGSLVLASYKVYADRKRRVLF
jgi:phosphoglycerol transferase MdoB-like AlkP superfamily enzyme